MIFRNATVASKAGLHARPASQLAKAAEETGLSITIAPHGGIPGDASSVLTIMGLGAKTGDVLTLAAEGEGADLALETLAAIIERDLDAQ